VELCRVTYVLCELVDCECDIGPDSSYGVSNTFNELLIDLQIGSFIRLKCRDKSVVSVDWLFNGFMRILFHLQVRHDLRDI
jgi:hypothetical protein